MIIGAVDPNPKVAGRGIKILEDSNIKVEIGLFDALVEKQNKFFFYKHKNKKPYITVKIASSFDGMSHINNERVFTAGTGIRVRRSPRARAHRTASVSAVRVSAE